MAREYETASQQQQWGSLDELLLACAVNRHGTKSWGSISIEVQNRSSSLASLTPQNCRDKFDDLRRQYMGQNDTESTSLVSLVDQLRQIRVQELRVEVQRRDVLIASLELKVKRLEEEREKSLKVEADMERDRKASLEIVAGKSSAIDGDDGSDNFENRSFNESNSMAQKAGATNKKQKDDVEEEKEPKIKLEPGGENDSVQARTVNEADRGDRDWSSNGKLNENVNVNVKDDDSEDNTKTVSKEKVESIKNKTSGVGGFSESNALWDDETKRGGKQSSEVQSSATLSKSKRRRTGGEGGWNAGGTAGCSSGEELDVHEVSPATKKVLAVKSEPLVRFLRIIRSYRLGSQFERRLWSQECERYNKLIRQHIDLQTIQSRLDRGLYSDCFHRFFRDLLMLFNNFIIFFTKSSQEFSTAQELRALVVTEMSDKLRKPKLKPKPEPKPLVTVKHEPKPPPALLSKPSGVSAMVVCGKRSTVKAIYENNAKSKKGNKKEREVEEKPKANEKKIDNSFARVEKKGGINKKKSQQRSVSARRNSRSNKKSGEVKHQYGGNELSSHDALVKMDNINKKENAAKKKQGAASFLKRMKQNSPVEDDDDSEEVEEADDHLENKDSKVEEEKKRRSGRKRDVKSERVTRSSRGRVVREERGRVKRSAATSPRETNGKGGRDNGESEVSRSRKRTRR